VKANYEVGLYAKFSYSQTVYFDCSEIPHTTVSTLGVKLPNTHSSKMATATAENKMAL